MARPPNHIMLSEEERQTLHRWLESPKADERLVLRGSIILMADQGVATKEIARRLKVRVSTVSRWRSRFAARRMVGLQDQPRSGKPPQYEAEHEKRILELADSRPPRGQGTWSGRLIAERLGDVSVDFVWKVLRRRNITLKRRRRFRIPVPVPFQAKTQAFGGLFLSPPENAMAILQWKAAAGIDATRTGVMRLPDSRAFHYSGSTEGKSLDLAGALDMAAQLVRAKEYPEHPKRHFLDFMDRLVSEHPGCEVHAFLNTMSTHKPGRDQWLARNPHVRFHYLSTFDDWLEQSALWMEMLFDPSSGKEARTHFKNLHRAIMIFSDAFDKNSSPFEWILSAKGKTP
jgi:transposase